MKRTSDCVLMASVRLSIAPSVAVAVAATGLAEPSVREMK